MAQHSRQPTRYRLQRGISLIEILVTTIVFSIGVLGIVSLNGVSKRSSYESVQRSTASQLSYALLEEMRSNSTALATYLAAGNLGGGSRGAEPAPNCSDPLVPCSAEEIAAHSLWDWERALDGARELSAGVGVGGLVSPTTCIAGPVGGVAGIYTVTIAWRGNLELDQIGGTNCGTASGLYGPGDVFRRTVVVRTFIDPAI
ncbi:MAG TPA: type IV pilus modification protein PilV [Gammaproteobacteria bacterium]